MGILTLFSIFACIGVLVLAGLVLGKDPSRRLYQIVGLFGIASAIWSLGFAVLYSITDAKAALFWIRFYELGLVFIPAIFYHFVIVFVPQERITWQKYVAYIGYALSLLFSLLIWTPYFATGVTKFSWGFYPTVGIASRAFNIMFVVYVSLGFLELASYMRSSTGRTRNQIKYLLAAAIIGFGLGVTNFLPLYGFSEVYPLGHFGAPIAIVILSYAIIKHQLLDIDFVVRRSVIYSTLTAVLAAAYVTLVFGLGVLFKDLTGLKSLLPVVIFAVIVALTFEPLHRNIQIIVDRVFFKKSYEYRNIINDVRDQLRETANPAVVSTFLLRRMAETLQVSHGWLLVYNRRLGVFQIASTVNPLDEIPFSLNLDSKSNLVEFIKSKGRPVVLEGSEGQLLRRDSDRKERNKLAGMGVALVAPLRGRNMLVGILILGSRKAGDYYRGEDLDLIASLCDDAAISMENASLYDELQTSYLNTVKSLVTALEAKDKYTRGHSERVAKYAKDIATEIGLSDKECQLLYEVSLLHDVGKIGISDHILNKPRKLTDSEYAQVQTHTVTGEKILSAVESLKDGLAIVRHHHERLNGDGYPDGLSESNIPLPARILAVADAYDAMTTKRPYRNAMSKKEAIEELKRHAFQQFDPKIVRAFVAVMMTEELTKSKKSTSIQEEHPRKSLRTA
jgi:HD-GYP domain-containing protein (c-di-GMP phosphodiesterase class II)